MPIAIIIENGIVNNNARKAFGLIAIATAAGTIKSILKTIFLIILLFSRNNTSKPAIRKGNCQRKRNPNSEEE